MRKNFVENPVFTLKYCRFEKLRLLVFMTEMHIVLNLFLGEFYFP